MKGKVLQQITNENFNEMLGRFTTPELENLIEKFPYFQQAHLLLAKKYQQENNPGFDQQLQLAALYTQDRELLFTLFHNSNFVIPETPPKQEIKVEPGIEKTAEVIQPESLITENIETVSKTSIIEETKVPAISEEETNTVVEVQNEIVVENISTREFEIAGNDVIEVKDEQKEEQVVQAVEHAFSFNEPHTFDEWLKAFDKGAEPNKEQKVEEVEEKDEELDRIIMENTPVGYLKELVEDETHYSKGLDKFIEEQIEKHKNNPVKPAAENEIDPELITETMAKVYEMQKKYSRAIKAYQILALKFPEKSDFFAARINYIKNII